MNHDPRHNAVLGVFWGTLFSLPIWLGVWFLLCHFLGVLCLHLH